MSMFMMRESSNIAMMRSIIVPKNQILAFIHVLIAVFYFGYYFNISYFDKIQSVSVFENGRSADITLFGIVNFLPYGKRTDIRKLLKNAFNL